MTIAAAQPTGGATLTLEQTRIHIPGVHRADTKRPPKLEDALDFWQFSGAAANVAMQMARPGVGGRRGGPGRVQGGGPGVGRVGRGRPPPPPAAAPHGAAPA
ncbi:hypothetical protein ACFXO7_15865, partial [Nocardia tengchongensis]